MSKKPTKITSNKNLMTIKDLKDCANALDSIFQALDEFGANYQEVVLRIIQYRDSFKTSNED